MKKFSLPFIIFLAIFVMIFVAVLVHSVVKKDEVVEDLPVAATKVHCRDGMDQSNFQCFKKKYNTYANFAGVAVAMEVMKKEYARSPYVTSQCHQLAHEVGHVGAQMYDDVAEAFAFGDAFCWSGYYHGVVEEYISSAGVEKVKSSLNNFCSRIPGKDHYSFDYYNCVHGLGHGVMAMTRNVVRESLDLCGTLAGSWEQESCYGGVFMENVMADLRDHGSADLKPDDLLYPCNSVDVQYKNACYLMQTSYMLSRNGYNFDNVFELCARADEGFVGTCATSAGRDASGSTISNPERAIAICNKAPNDFMYQNCIIGAVRDFVAYHHGDTEAKKFCALAESSVQPLCYSTVEADIRQQTN